MKKKKLKAKLKLLFKAQRMVIDRLEILREAHRVAEGYSYFDPKWQHAFEGVRGHIASIEKRLGILEQPNVVSLKRRRV